jgi:diguanylate cyclase (GGDEF)-like protein
MPRPTDISNATPQRPRHSAPTVACYAPQQELGQLTGLLEERYYKVAVASQSNLISVPQGGLVAAIVSDAIDDPLATCRRIGNDCPTILLSSNISLNARRAAVRCGVDAIISRPLNELELASWLEQFGSLGLEDPATVAIIDDDADSAALYALALRAAGMEVRTIKNPLEALSRLDNLRPDLIIMDLHMPNMNGIELIRVIRQCRQFTSVPIVSLSAETCPDLQLEARSYGADDFITKPIALERLVSIAKLRTERFRLLRSMVERDGLTGLLTHARLKDRLAIEIERCGRTSRTLSFAMIDIDHFKAINDRYGHPFGDIVIRGLARLLCKSVRKIDIVGRYGGEEFGVVLLDTPVEAAQIVMTRIRQRFAETNFDSAGEPVNVTFSAGVAAYHPEIGLDRLIAHADTALYKAKDCGRNRVARARVVSGLAPAAAAQAAEQQPRNAKYA